MHDACGRDNVLSGCRYLDAPVPNESVLTRRTNLMSDAHIQIASDTYLIQGKIVKNQVCLHAESLVEGPTILRLLLDIRAEGMW